MFLVYFISIAPAGNRINLEASRARGNLEYVIEYVIDYTYDSNNRLVSERYKKDGTTVSEQMNHYYDNNGNEIKTMKGNTIYEEKTYNKFNQLISMKKGSQTAQYTYKPDGIRLSKNVNNKKTNFVTVDGNIFAELDQNGSFIEEYIRDMNNIIRGSKVYYLYNGHGDVTQLANFSGIVTKNYDYDSYGVDGKDNWYDNFYNNDTNPWRYCGEYFDYETKTVYLRARNYAPNTGRFNSEDPARAELNWYTYCNGNPLMFIDPSGLEKIVVSGGAYSDPSVHKGFKYNFIEPAIKQLNNLRSSNKNETITWIIANEGWTTEDRNGFTESIKNLNVNILYLSNADELINYINVKDMQGIADSSGKELRKDDLITSFTVFSHGLVADNGIVALGYNYSSNYNQNLNVKTNHISSINQSAFNAPVSNFYSCNTATAGDKSFAYLWYKQVGGNVLAFAGTTDYNNIMYSENYSKYNPFTWSEKFKINSARKEYGFSLNGSYRYPMASKGVNEVNYN